jgi:pimeloyl-ACP methyl ester carboxylesterase
MRWRYFDHWWRYLIIILPLKEAQISLLFDQISKSGDGGNLGIIFGYSSYSIYPSILVSTPPKLIHYKLDKGGHFAAWEQPELFSEEVHAGFRPLRK